MDLAAVKKMDRLPPWLAVRELHPDSLARLKAQFHGLLQTRPYPCVTCGAKESGAPHTFLGVDGDVCECDCIGQRMLWLYLVNAGLGIVQMQFTWEDVTAVHPESIRKINDYLDYFDAYAKRGLGLILWNPNKGTGKSLLAALLFKRLLERQYDGYFIQFKNMLDIFTSSWRSDDERQWFDSRLRNAGALVLDDIGQESDPRLGIASDCLETVLRNRAYHGLPTIITTNLTLHSLKARYGDAVGSLLGESFIDINVTSDTDFRDEAKNQRDDEARRGVVRPVTFG